MNAECIYGICTIKRCLHVDSYQVMQHGYTDYLVNRLIKGFIPALHAAVFGV